MDDKPSPRPPDTPIDPQDLKEDSHPFVIKLWLEEKATAVSPALWRGHITHAYTRRRRHIQSLEEINDFIGPYIARWLHPHRETTDE